MLIAAIVASPCLLLLCFAAVMGASRIQLDIRRRHRRAVFVANSCAKQRELAKHKRE